MPFDETLTRTGTLGTAKLTPVDALTRFSPTKLARGTLSAYEVAHLRYGVRVANLGLLVPAGIISEVVEGLPVHPMPNAAAWFAGMVNLRGNLIPVFDLQTLLTGNGAGLQRLLVLDRGERAAAIPIDELPKPVDMQQRSIQVPPVPAEIEPYVRRGYLDNAEIWVDLDFIGLFEALGARVGA
jgi:twitching motility protein PilI